MSLSLHELFRCQGANLQAFDQRILELRRVGLSYTAIAKMVAYLDGLHVSEYQVRYRLDQLGAPKDPRRVGRRQRTAA